MSDSLAMQITVRLAWNNSSPLDLSTPIDAGSLDLTDNLATGTGNDQSDLIWHDERTLASGASDSLDLNALTKTLFGSTITTVFVKIKGIVIHNKSTTAGEKFTVGNGTNPFVGPFGGTGAHTQFVEPDGVYLQTNPRAGWTVTNATADVLKILNAGAGSNIYDIAIWGTSA